MTYDVRMFRRIAAIVFIFLCTAGAWVILGSTILYRTYHWEPSLREKVAGSWGAPQEQLPPSATYPTAVTRKKTSMVNGKQTEESEVQYVNTPMPLESSKLDVGLDLDYRQKGLLWYSTYRVQFAGVYGYRNATGKDQVVTFAFHFPAENAVYDDMSMAVDGQPVTMDRIDPKSMGATVTIPNGASRQFRVSYRSQGLESWRYGFGSEVAQVHDFTLRMKTNFADIDFPDNGLSPTTKQRAGAGWLLTWDYRNLVSGYKIGMKMPVRIQPGPLAGEISYFAPVSLFFYFFAMFMITTIRKIDLHPMNYFFLAAAFFAFHLLLAYLVDHISIHAAFVIASLVSVGLVVSYLRLVTGAKFAVREAGIGQVVYLVLFSYAFFFKGFTGLTVTIGAIVTLFVAMQMTGRMDWTRVFAAGPPALPTSPTK